MSIIKSLSVGNGDMFYIDHNSDNWNKVFSDVLKKLNPHIVVIEEAPSKLLTVWRMKSGNRTACCFVTNNVQNLLIS